MTKTEIAYHALIDSYLEGGLKGEALNSFRQQLITDSQLAKDVELHQAANSIVSDYGLLQVKAKLQKIHEKHQAATTPQKNWNKVAVGATVLAVTLLASAAWYYGQQDTAKEAQLQQAVVVTEQPTSLASAVSSSQSTDLSVVGSTAPSPSDAIAVTSAVPPSEATIDNQSPPSQTILPASETAEKTETDQNLALERTQLANDQPAAQPKDLAIQVQPPSRPLAATNSDPIAAPKPIATADPCKETDIIFEVGDQAEDLCEGRLDGRIEIETHSISGGKAPFGYSIDGGQTFNDSPVFTKLHGNQDYDLVVKDANGCLSKAMTTRLYARECADLFSPLQGQTWEIPVDVDDHGLLRITSQRGVVFQARINSGYPNTWDGRGSNSNYVEDGAYIWTIQLDNGSQMHGEVTVAR